MTTVLGAEAVTQLDIIHRIAKALITVTSSTNASFNPNDSKLNVSIVSAEDTISILENVGHSLAAAADMLASAVEVQLAEFFSYMKNKETSSLVELLKIRTAVPTGFYVKSQENKSMEQDNVNPIENVVTKDSSKSKVLQNVTLGLNRCDRRAIATTMQTCLFLMMESVLTHVNATRVAVYLNDGSDKPHTLFRVAHIHGEEKLPLEVSYANTSTLISVVKSGLAINFDTTINSNELNSEQNNLSTENARHPLKVRSGMIIPIGNYGCVLVADKRVSKSHFFTPFDEHKIWNLAIICEGIFSRYPRSLFIGMSWIPSVEVLRQCSLLPTILLKNQVDSSLNVSEKGLEPILEDLRLVPKQLTILRVTGNNISSIQDTKGLPRKNITYEGLLQGSSEYINKMELLWQQTLQEVNSLRLRISTHEREVNEKNSRINKLEREVRRLNVRLVSTGKN